MLNAEGLLESKYVIQKINRVLTKLAKWNSPSYLGFPDPLNSKNSYFQAIIKTKPDVTNFILAAFLQKYRILYLEHGDCLQSTHASHYATQPIYATVTDNYAQSSMPMITLTKIPSKFKIHRVFPEFSRIKKFPQVFRSCKHPEKIIHGMMWTSPPSNRNTTAGYNITRS